MTSHVVVALLGQRRVRVLNSGAGLSGSSDILLRFALGFHNYTLTNYPELKPEAGWLKTSKICSLAVLEAASLKSRCGRGHAPFEGPGGGGGDPFLPLPASGGSWSSLVCGRITSIAASVVT